MTRYKTITDVVLGLFEPSCYLQRMLYFTPVSRGMYPPPKSPCVKPGRKGYALSSPANLSRGIFSRFFNACKFEEQLEKLKIENKSLTEMMNTSIEQNTALEIQVKEVELEKSRLSDKVDTMNELISELQMQIDTKDKQIACLDNYIREHVDMDDATDDVTSNESSSHGENMMQISQLEASFTTDKMTIDECRQHIVFLEHERHVSQEMNTRLEDRLHTYQEKYSHTSELMGEVWERCRTLEEKVEESRKVVEKQSDCCCRLQEELRDVTAVLDDRSEQLSASTELMANLSAKLIELETQNTEAALKSATQEDMISQLTIDLEGAKEQISISDDMTVNFQDLLLDYQKQHSKTNKEFKRIEQRNTDLQFDCDDLEAVVTAQKRKISQLNKLNIHLQSELAPR